MKKDNTVTVSFGPTTLWGKFIHWFTHTWLGLKIWPMHIIIDGQISKVVHIKGNTVTLDKPIHGESRFDKVDNERQN